MASDVVMITGAGGDIGRAVAVCLAESGLSLALCDHPRARESLVHTAALCDDRAASGRVAAFEFDVTDVDAVNGAVSEIVDALAIPKMLFNNAGYQGEIIGTLDCSVSDFQKVIDINVVGLFSVLRSVATAMSSSGHGGTIVNTASMAGVSGAVNMVGYSTSKSAVIGLTKSAAKDLAPHRIRVNSVSPGFIGPGAMWERQVELQAHVASQYYSDDQTLVEAEMVAQVPLRRYGSLNEVADVVLFLLSERSSYMTGTNLEVSGGAA